MGSFVSELCCGQTDRQTNKETDSKILPTPTDIVGVRKSRPTVDNIDDRDHTDATVTRTTQFPTDCRGGAQARPTVSRYSGSWPRPAAVIILRRTVPVDRLYFVMTRSRAVAQN